MKLWRQSFLGQQYRNFIALIVFGTAFGFVEAAVVYYLRDLIRVPANYNIGSYHMLLNLGFIAFVSPAHPLLISGGVAHAEVMREAATIIMLLAVSYLAGHTLRQRIGAFLISFACWDLLYYVFLKVLDNWPGSLLTQDVYFLIPVTWIGPVITPVIISTAMLLGGAWLFLRLPADPK